jgi:O-antigen ligase
MQWLSRRATDFGWWLAGVSPFTWGIAAFGMATGLLIVVLAELNATLAFLPMTLLAAVAVVVLRQYALLGALAIVAAIFLDFYQVAGLPLHEPIIGLLMASAVVAYFFLAQSDHLPWIAPRNVVAWLIFLLLTAPAVPRGPLSDTVSYFVTTIITSLVFYLLGTQIARDSSALRRLLTFLVLIASFIAAHSIVQGLTGVFLFATERQADYLASVSNFHLANSTFIRAGSFLENPDWNGAFLALMVLVAAGLLFSAATRRAKVFYGVQLVLLLIALLFTFTTASLLAAAIGLVIFGLLVITARYRLRDRLYALLFGGIGLTSLLIVFRSQALALLEHATGPNELSFRLGDWETALRVIRAYPLTGIGLSDNLYIVRAEPFRVALQTRPLAHPHNAYLELAAFAGLPVLLAFLALLGLMLRDAIRLFRAADPSHKAILGGLLTGLVVFSINSIAINGWTLPPLAALAWLLFGAATSRALEPPRRAAVSAWTTTLQSGQSESPLTGAGMPWRVEASAGAGFEAGNGTT